MRNKRAVLFDLDGTLIDTTGLILKCFDHSWQTICGRTHSREALLGTFGIPLREAMRLLVGASNDPSLAASQETAKQGSDEAQMIEARMIEELILEYRAFNVVNHDLLAKPFDGVERVVSELRSRGYLIGVVTSKGRELAMRGLNLCSLDGLIDEAVFLEDSDRHKPDPMPINVALKRLGAHPEAAAYVGDSCHDIAAGRAARVRTVAALWGPASRVELEKAQPDWLAENVDSLLDIFAH
jgi:pyrophosphatase PpaX